MPMLSEFLRRTLGPRSVPPRADLVWSLAPVTLLDRSGRSVRLGDLWANRAVVLRFVPGLGGAAASPLPAVAAQIRDGGARIVHIVPGPLEQALGLKADDADTVVLADPALHAYERARMANRRVVASRGADWGRLGRWLLGRQETQQPGELVLQGGTIVIGPGNLLLHCSIDAVGP